MFAVLSWCLLWACEQRINFCRWRCEPRSTGEIKFAREGRWVVSGGWGGGCLAQEDRGKTWMSAGILGKGRTGQQVIGGSAAYVGVFFFLFLMDPTEILSRRYGTVLRHRREWGLRCRSSLVIGRLYWNMRSRRMHLGV